MRKLQLCKFQRKVWNREGSSGKTKTSKNFAKILMRGLKVGRENLTKESFRIAAGRLTIDRFHCHAIKK